MRKLHYLTRKYSEPFKFIKFREDYIDGVKKIEPFQTINAYGSFMYNQKLQSGGNQRNLKTDLSLVTHNPPFLLDESFRVIFNNDQYVITSINYNALTRGEINLTLSWEAEYVEN